jgi:predicted  nucleic acid-binding Zn-ribbon protein
MKSPNIGKDTKRAPKWLAILTGLTLLTGGSAAALSGCSDDGKAKVVATAEAKAGSENPSGDAVGAGTAQEGAGVDSNDAAGDKHVENSDSDSIHSEEEYAAARNYAATLKKELLESHEVDEITNTYIFEEPYPDGVGFDFTRDGKRLSKGPYEVNQSIIRLYSDK